MAILRGYCNLSAYNQVVFFIFSSISTKVPEEESIVEEYARELDEIAIKLSDGYRLDINDDLNEKQIEKFYKVLDRVIGRVGSL